MDYWWTCWDADGAHIALQAAESRFPSQADAEAWMGESWSQLLAAGATSVTLMHVEEPVYGPMGLSAD